MDLFEPKRSFSFSKKVSINQEIQVISDDVENQEIENKASNRNINDENIEDHNTKREGEIYKIIREPEDFFINVDDLYDNKKVEINVSQYEDFIDEIYLNDEPTIDENKIKIQQSSLIRRGSVDGLIKRQYEQNYNLNDKQFFLIKDYFESMQQDDLIEKKVFKNHLIESIKVKKNISATESDVDRTLNVIDSDLNDQLDFSEFIDYLTLFLTNEKTLKRTIVSTLNGHQFTNEHIGFLTLQEALEQVNYLYKFYGRINEDEVAEDFPNFEENLSYDKFAEMISPYLRDYIFVKI